MRCGCTWDSFAKEPHIHLWQYPGLPDDGSITLGCPRAQKMQPRSIKSLVFSAINHGINPKAYVGALLGNGYIEEANII